MKNLLRLLMAVAWVPAMAAAQEFQYSNAWNVEPYSQAGFPQYVPDAYSQGVYGQPDHGLISTQPGEGIPAAYGYPEASYAPVAACEGDNCGHCCPSRCSTGRCLHRSGIFSEFLYWKASGADVSYGVPQDGIGGIGTVPVGDVGVLDFDHEASFRVGFNLALNCQSSVSVAYTKFETNTDHVLFIPPPFVIQPLVMAPGTFNAGFTAQVAVAETSLEMDSLDVEYRAVLTSCSKYHVNFLAGARYAELDQSLGSVFLFAPPDGTTFVFSELDFEGAGLRIGLDGERFILPRMGISVYGKAVGGVLGGEFRGTYAQINQFNGTEAFTTWEDARLVPIGEAEVGFRWANRRDSLRLSVGYYVGMWGNMVTTPEWIEAVQGLNFVDISRDSSDSIRFDGLVARAELRL